MFVDARSLSDGQRIEADVCIIGGGAAGITIARELIGTGIRVALLEGGDIGWDEQAQDLYAGESVGFPGWSLDEARLRYFGGSTNHWAGNCVPLDPIDFESRPGVPHSGWPIGRETLDPYYLRALPIVGCRSERPFDVEQLTAEAGLPVLPLDPASGLRNIVVNQSPPTQFGFAYEDELAAAENVVVYLNAHVLEIELDDLASRVTGVRIGTFDGPALSATARHYILCAGGIENARLMLASTGVAPAGVGNDNDLVGRFFMDHIGVRPGLRVLMSDNAPDLGLYATQHELADGRAYAAIFGTDEVLREEGIGGFWISMFPHEGISPGHGSGRALRKGLTSGELPDQLGWHVGNVLTDLDGLLNGAYRFATGGEEDLVARQWMDLWVTVESIPLPDSRVMLGEARDPFGMPRVVFDWRVADEDVRTAERACTIMAREIGRSGMGRPWSYMFEDGESWPGWIGHGKHHIGTTRMADDPRQGVVDQDCRVHGIANLMVGGSSVFPTGGVAPPTLTIVALALRIADTVKADLANL